MTDEPKKKFWQKVNLKDSWRAVKDAVKVFMGTPKAVRLVWSSHPRYAVAIMVMNLWLGVNPVLQMWITKQLIDSITVGDRLVHSMALLSKSAWLLIAVVAVDLVAKAIEPTMQYLQAQLGDYLSRDIEMMILKKTNSFADISVFENPEFYDQLQRAEQEVSYRPVQMLNQLVLLIRYGIGFFSMVGIVVAFEPALAILLVLFALPNLYTEFKHQRESWSMHTSETPEVRRMWYFQHVLTNSYDAKEIRIFGLQNYFVDQVAQKFDAFQKRHSKMRRQQWHGNLALSVVSAVASGGGFVWIVVEAFAGRITLGTLILLSGAVNAISGYLYSMIWSLSALYEGNLFMDHLYKFLAIEPSYVPAPAGVALKVPLPMCGGIEFRNVDFSYQGTDKKVLDGVSFSISPGQTVALVGANGAGKTTIVKLLSRLYDPTAGEVLIDGIDLKEFDIDDWRDQMAVLFQDYSRFHMTARENVGLGRVDLVDDMTAVKSAAQRGGAATLIEKLPDGYENMLGRWFRAKDVGADLSVGEWQKVALARTFMRSRDDPSDRAYTDAQVLILDEPTASLDVQSEAEVFTRFHELTRGKTTILISHRFSSVRMAEVILVLDDGKITEQGSHEELMKLDGTYARLYKMQAERYLD